MSETLTLMDGKVAPECLYLVPGGSDSIPLVFPSEPPTVAETRVEREKAVKYVRADCLAPLIKELEANRHVLPGNSPGHSHDIPGIWDRTGNPEHLSGQPCERCRVWNEVKALVLAREEY